MAFSEFMATGMPPPMRKNTEPKMAKLTCGVLSTTSIKGPQAKVRIMPTYARMKEGLRPMLPGMSGQQDTFCSASNTNSPISQDTIGKRGDKANNGADHGGQAAQVGQLLLDAVNFA
jgi:hypothetical protein